MQMNDEPVIEFDNVYKEYLLYKNEKERFRAIFTHNKGVKRHAALKGISFSIRSGEAVGIIGKNGAGKSTVLKMITGVSFPSKGNVHVRGKVAALLELTAGFSLDMTGIENLYLKCYLLGLSEEQVKAIEGEIIEFADLGDYIDQPVRTYSSGMKMRLGFAININIKPDVLVVDEALSVGDAEFRMKCRAKINDLIDEGVTVLFVSHSKDAISEICTRAIFLKNGKVKVDGTVEEAFEEYNKKSPKRLKLEAERAARVAAKKVERIKKAVEKGQMTQAEADEILAAMPKVVVPDFTETDSAGE